MMDWIVETIGWLGPLGVGLLMFAENIVPPIPSEVIMSLAGFVSTQGQLSLPLAIVAAVIGTVAGNAVWYELSRAFGPDRAARFAQRWGRFVGVDGRDVREAQALLARRGAWIVFGARFRPGPRTLISVPAGIVHRPRTLFYVLTTLGSTIWIVFLAMCGVWLGENYGLIEQYLKPLAYVTVVAVAAFVVWWFWRRRRRRALPPA